MERASRLSEKVCIITGTGGSIGREAARAFAQEGAMVVGCDLTVDAAQATVDMVRAAGGTMVSMQPCRLTKPADCQALVDFAVSTFGRIDVLFNNAAMAYFNWIEDISDDEWDRDRREEVDLVFYLTRAAWPHLKTSHGVVVNTGSLNGLLSFKTLPSLADTTAKAGVIAMTRQLAMEGREHGIRANGASPGGTTNRRRSTRSCAICRPNSFTSARTIAYDDIALLTSVHASRRASKIGNTSADLASAPAGRESRFSAATHL